MAEADETPACGGDNAVDEKEAWDGPQPSQPSLDEGEPQPRRDPKEDVILDACRRRDIAELQFLAESPGGFLTDQLREEACEFLATYLTSHHQANSTKGPFC